MKTDPTTLGTVQSVTGPTVSVVLDAESVSGLAFIEGHGYRIGQVGSFVRIPMGYLDLFGVVSQVGAAAIPEGAAESQPYGHRWLTVQLVGEGRSQGGFKRGISQYPTIGDQVHLLTDKDLARVYGRPNTPDLVSLGTLASAESLPALVDINKLVTRHVAVVGTTGAGKSTTVAGLITSLTDPERFPSSRVIVLDVHGEYATALRDRATVFRVSPDPARGEVPLYIPYWAMTYDELVSVTMGVLDDVSRWAVLEKITAMKLAALERHPVEGVSADTLTVDSPVPFSIHRFWLELHRLVNGTYRVSGGQSEDNEALALDEDGEPVQRGDAMRVIPPVFLPHTQASGQDKIYLSQSPLNIRRQIEGLAAKLRDPRFDFLLRPGPWCPNVDGTTDEDLDGLVKQWIGGPKPVAILDLSGIPPSVLSELVGVLLRVIYDAVFWARNLAEGGRQRPLVIVLEEAHSYVGPNAKGAASTAVTRIVKEGRKYGIGALVVSQRPAELDQTVLSQCGTIVAMRLSNPTDCAHVRGTVSDSLEGLLSMLPVLRTGEAIIVGEATHLPMRTLIAPPSADRRPDSDDPLVYDDFGPGGWNRGRIPDDYADVVAVWRSQQPYSRRALRSKTGEEAPTMNRQPVSSSNLCTVGYDSGTCVLEIEFHGGRVYQYFDVPQHIHEALMTAGSHGEYFAAYIKNTYRCAQV